MIPKMKDSENFKNPRFQEYMIPMNQDSKNPGVQKSMISRIQDFKNAGLQVPGS